MFLYTKNEIINIYTYLNLIFNKYFQVNPNLQSLAIWPIIIIYLNLNIKLYKIKLPGY